MQTHMGPRMSAAQATRPLSMGAADLSPGKMLLTSVNLSGHAFAMRMSLQQMKRGALGVHMMINSSGVVHPAMRAWVKTLLCLFRTVIPATFIC